ncbi:hypothetical protein ACC697_39010, partial [Rhizobium ruizarguesonis]
FTSFAFLPLLAAAKSVGGFAEPGNIINISSMSGVTITSQRGQFNYNASKCVAVREAAADAQGRYAQPEPPARDRVHARRLRDPR